MKKVLIVEDESLVALDISESIKEILQYYHPFIIFLTAFSDEEHIEKAIILQPLGYLIKPIHNKEKKRSMEKIYRNYSL